MSTSGVDRRRVLGGVLLAAAGAYILFQPFGTSPGECALGGIIGDVAHAITVCVAAGASMFVVGSVVGLVSIVVALWILAPTESRGGSVLLAVAVLAIVGAGVVALATSPSGPFRTIRPTETALPVQTSFPRQP